MGKLLALLLSPFMGKHRRYARINLSLCFAQLDPADRERLLRANLVATVTGALELIRTW